MKLQSNSLVFLAQSAYAFGSIGGLKVLSPKLAPEMRAILEAMAAQGAPPLESLPVAQARQVAHGLSQLAGEPETAQVEQGGIIGRGGTIPIRIYTPNVVVGPLPGVVYLHGGGWVICDLDTHDNVCRAICNRAGAVVVAVDYRLAPEHKFPAALEDCIDAFHGVVSMSAILHIDPQRLAIAGDSAGATMATVIAAKSRDARGPAVALQVLVYPATNLSKFDTASHREFAEDHFLTRASMDWFMSHYFRPSADRTNPAASPAFLKDLQGLAPALVITAECDPLRDEGEAYAQRLKDSGVTVTLTRYDGMIHPFLNFLGASAGAQKAVDQIAAAVRSM